MYSAGALQRIKHRLADHYHEAYNRDRHWIMSLDVELLNKIIWPLFIGFICLNFLDVYTTTLAMNFAPFFHEENPIAAAMFDKQFQGYVLALVFKYLPVVPLFYIVFVRDPQGKHTFAIKLVRFTALVTLCGADILLFYIVGIHNIESLLTIRV